VVLDNWSAALPHRINFDRSPYCYVSHSEVALLYKQWRKKRKFISESTPYKFSARSSSLDETTGDIAGGMRLVSIHIKLPFSLCTAGSRELQLVDFEDYQLHL
jgi:hypothetical protein